MTPPRTRTREAGTVDGGPAERARKQLEERLVYLQEELDKEREEKSFFLLERDKTRALWEITKRNLEEVESELRRRSREREELEESHRVEIGVYKQKLKHILSEKQRVSELEDGVCSSSTAQNPHRELVRGVQGLQGIGREKQGHEELKLKHQVELMERRNDYERQLREVEVSFHQRLQSLMEAEHKKQWAAVREVERQMRSRENFLLADRDRALRRAEEYHCSTETRLQDDLKTLKEELQEEKKQRKRTAEDLSTAQQENKHLTTSLCEAQQKLVELQRHLQEQQQDKDAMTKRCARLKVVETELREQTEEHKLLQEAFKKVQAERDALLRSQTQTILDVQQRSELKKSLLERKLAALTETLEQKEAQLLTALPGPSADPAAAKHTGEEVLESRPVSVDTLQESLSPE
ncbi:dynein regulatory complex subunit 4-like [Cololabis saira]|uniref:dynein regulatory complex subunit 4-like n=1 Tax=Cololabis saira TaxID=129043 RepID=UPI002AD5A7D1|nr:dynein regulatory complex subunit 4-like [Cololabis saira]